MGRNGERSNGGGGKEGWGKGTGKRGGGKARGERGGEGEGKSLTYNDRILDTPLGGTRNSKDNSRDC